jgi:signal transduction histidine kinase
MHRRDFMAVAGGALLIALSGAAGAEAARASVDEAQAMVKKAIDYYKKNGRDKALAEISRADGKLTDRDLYVTVYTLDGVCLAHINPRVVGKNMIDQRDTDGKHFTRERLEAAKTQPSGWQDFKFFNPMTKKVEPKRQYWERYDNLVFAAGAYRPE